MTSTSVHLYAATQPIVRSDGTWEGEEILYRPSATADTAMVLQPPMDDDGTGRTAQSMLWAACSGLAPSRRFWVNVPEAILEQVALTKVPLPLPAETTVIEILETTRATPPVLEAIGLLHDHGYRFALDDCELPRMDPFLEHADYLKVDRLASSPENAERCVEAALRRGIVLVAEKVESLEEIERCRRRGYSCFQGYAVAPPRTKGVVLQVPAGFARWASTPAVAATLDAPNPVGPNTDEASVQFLQSLAERAGVGPSPTSVVAWRQIVAMFLRWWTKAAPAPCQEAVVSA